jgi:hypothetical protein
MPKTEKAETRLTIEIRNSHPALSGKKKTVKIRLEPPVYTSMVSVPVKNRLRHVWIIVFEFYFNNNNLDIFIN